MYIFPKEFFMTQFKTAKKELNGVLFFFCICKFLLLLTGLILGPVLSVILSLMYGDNAENFYREFASYGTISGLFLEISVFVLTLFVPTCLYFFFSGEKFKAAVPMEKPEPLQICFGVGSTIILGNLAATVGNVLLSILFALFGMSDKYNAMLENNITYPSNIWLIPLFAIMLAVLPAFFEEFAMRGIGLNVTKKFGILFSLFFSGFFFAFMHSSWVQLPFAFVIGILLAYFTLRFKTIWIAVISHFIFNFNSVVQCIILQNAGDSATLLLAIWSILVSTLMIGFMVAGLIIYGIRRPDLPKSEFSAGQKMKMLFSSPFLYIFMALESVQLIYLLMIY